MLTDQSYGEELLMMARPKRSTLSADGKPTS